MLLLYVTASCVLFGGSAAILHNERVCYGRSYSLPFRFSPPLFNGQIYFTPKKGGSRKLILDKGEAKDPRLQVNYGSLRLTDLTETDAGVLNAVYDEDRQHDIINLVIADCDEKTVRKYYGDRYYLDVPRLAEVLKFMPLENWDEPQILWNRTDPQANRGGRGQMKRRTFEMMKLNQGDSGFYNFRAKDNTLLSWIKLAVQENEEFYERDVNDQLVIRCPGGVTPWIVAFRSEDESHYNSVIDHGEVVPSNWQFAERIEILNDGIEIFSLKNTDSGTFAFRDKQGNLIMNAQVTVLPAQPSTFVYVGVIAVIIFLVIACCCCVRKCCCKKSSKREVAVPPPEPTPAGHYHGVNRAGPSSSAAPVPRYSYQPMNSLVSTEPTTTSLEPSVYNPVNIHVNPPHPEIAPPGADPALSLGSSCLSSDPVPTFELKGLLFSSAPPLSSDAAFCHVYTSDKLNF